MATNRKTEPHGTAAKGPEGFTGAELLAAFSAVVAGGKSAQEAVKLIAPLIRGKVALLVQVLRGGTDQGRHTVSFRLTNPTAHGVYLKEVRLDSPEGVPIAAWTYEGRRMDFGTAEGLRELALPAFLPPGKEHDLWCTFDAEETKKRIFNLGYAKVKFVCDVMDSMDPVETVVGFRLREGAP